MLDRQYQISGHPNYTLQGMDVFKAGDLHPVKRVMNNRVLGWYLDRTFVSRSKIKQLISHGILTR